MHSTPDAARLKAWGSKTLRLALAGCVAGAFAPAAALAAYSPVNTTGKAILTGESGDSWNNALIKTAKGLGSVSYTGIVHSDLVHYSAYGLTTTISYDANGALTAINLTSGNETFAGSWGYLNVGKAVAPIEGYLPDGCSFAATYDALNKAYVPVLTDKNGYGSSVTQVTLMTVAADGSLASSEEQVVTTGGRGEQVTTYGDWDNELQRLVLSEEHAQVNLVCVTYTIGAESAITFNTYFAIAADGGIDVSASSAANKYVDAITPTSWSANPNLAGTMAETNRDKWTAVMGTVYLARTLQSWSASLKSGYTAAGEVDDLDTVSGATKTSEPFVAALNQAVLDGYVSSVAEDVRFTIDGKAIDLNSNPMDCSTVSTDAQGRYVLTNIFPVGEDRNETHGTTLDSIATYSIPGGTTTAEVLALSKGRSKYKPVQTYNPRTVIGYEEDDGDPIYSQGWPEFADLSGDITVDYDAEDGTAPIGITVNNSAVTHLALTYTIGHGTITLVYDLAQMAQVAQVEATIDAIKSGKASTVTAARKAYNALSTDVRGYVGNTAKLVAAESALKAKQTIKLSKTSISLTAAASKKAKKSYTVSVTGAKVALSADTSAAAYEAGITVKASGKKSVKVVVPKGTKKGTYKLTVTAKSSSAYRASAAKTIKVKVS
ncbi:MAG: hypothetical protein ACI36Y_03265 [Coriobacteriales bacterium]